MVCLGFGAFWGFEFRVLDSYLRCWGFRLTGVEFFGRFGRICGVSGFRSIRVSGGRMWEFPKIRGTLFWGPYSKDPTI